MPDRVLKREKVNLSNITNTTPNKSMKMSASYKKPTPPPRSASVKNRPQLSSVPIKRTQSADQNSEGYQSDLGSGGAEATKSDSLILREIPPPEKPRDLKLHVVLPNVGSSRLSTKTLSSPEDVNV